MRYFHIIISAFSIIVGVQCVLKGSIAIEACHLNSQGHNFYKLKYISLEEVKIVPLQQ